MNFVKAAKSVFYAAILTASPTFASTNEVIRCAADLAAAVEAGRVGARFDITATVTFPCNPFCCTFAVEDDTGAAALREDAIFPICPLKAGDRVHLIGLVCEYTEHGTVYAADIAVEILSSGPAPAPIDTSIAELMAGRHANRLVRFKGKVRDAFVDEIDSRWCYIVVQDGRDVIYTCYPVQTQKKDALLRLIGAEVHIVGMCNPVTTGTRMIERLIAMTGADSMAIIRPAPKDPFEVPTLGASHHEHAAIIKGIDRRRAAGRVIAVWHGDRILLLTKERRIVRVDLAECKPPEYGTDIEAVGTPETDLFNLNLSRAIWRPSASNAPLPPEPAPERVSVSQLMTSDKGHTTTQVKYHGQPIRITGIVRSLPAPNHPYDRLGLECDRQIIPIDASACSNAFDGIEIGCELEATGICLIETENWRPNAPFPHVEGLALIVRTPEDVRIIARPPWWTPKRLMAMIGVLLAALAGIFLWNRSLNRLAERRGRELSEESVAHIAADLKVGERTRLAIELHDALSQNLTGVSLEIATAAKLVSKIGERGMGNGEWGSGKREKGGGEGERSTLNPQRSTLHHLDIAARSLKSCRDELRNCIWDLRNCALEEADMNDAVRRTLAPFIDGVDLVVRFNVPRTRLPDDTAHALLRIIRELVQNAIRHGHAKNIRVAGCIEDDLLRFSVADDGGGFDPDNCAGVKQGHFGLQGIRERVSHFSGKMSIESAPGAGTKATISIKLIVGS